MIPGTLNGFSFISLHSNKLVYTARGYLFYSFSYVENLKIKSAIYTSYEDNGAADNTVLIRNINGGYNTLKQALITINAAQTTLLLAGGFE